jgi:hypothetical protein
MIRRSVFPNAEQTEQSMKKRALTIPEVMLIAGTRAALGAGVGLLISDFLSETVRKGAGWTLVAVGGLSTIPLIIGLLGKPAVEP